MNNTIINAMPIIFIVIFVVAIIIIGSSILQVMSPKFRGKMMSRQIKATKYMMDESKEDLQDISTNMAAATKDGIETTVRAIKKGITEDEDIHCKHCGSKIDNDSKFCKNCGKEQ